MTRKGFTLIELIFVIVIIGILAAVAIPKYQNLRQNAEVNNALKVVTDAMSSVPSSYVNMVDLEGQTNVTLKDLVEIKGKGWSYASTGNGQYTYAPTGSGGDIAVISLDNNRTLTYTVNCTNFADETSQGKCKKVLGITADSDTQSAHF